MVPGDLIGRDAELAELEARARSNRLVTVVGPGGVGKTALAGAVAERVADGFPLGVRRVDLTRVDDERAVPGAMAAQLGFDSFDALLSSPNDRPLLLVVDNCEHLLDATAASLVQVLGACRQPTVLATSRSPLELPGESVMALAPLALPTDGDPLECPSVQLLLRRCRDAGAVVEESDLPAIVELCRRLDGLPLAIEIAAARARTMSVVEIAERLAEGVNVLERPRFRGDPRHRSVAETVRWSFDLLSPGTAALLERLAVFAGPFPASAGRAVAAAEPSGTTAFDTELDELVDASLVVVDTSGDRTQYRLLDTVRQFALARLRARDELDAAYDRFVDHVLDTSRQLLAGATATWRPGLLHDVVGRYDEVAEALRWCNANDPTPRRAHGLCGVLWSIVHQGHAEDIVELTRSTLERWPDDRSRGAVRAVAALATAEYVTGRPSRAIALAERWIDEAPADDLSTVQLRRVLGQARRALGDTDGALRAFREGAAIGHALGMDALALELDVTAAIVTADVGDVSGAIGTLESVVEVAATGGSTIVENWARTALAWVVLRHDRSRSVALIDTALTQARDVDYPIGVAVNLRSRAYAQLLVDDLSGAATTIGELLDDLIRRGALSNGRLLLDVAAVLAHRAGHPAWDALVASARSLPITTLVCAHFELVPLPATSVPPIPRHDVFAAVRNLLADVRESTVARDPADEPPPDRPTGAIVRHGDTVELTFGGRSVTVRSSKGVVDLIRLIEAGGRELHCLDLAGAGVEEPSTGALIDDEARRRYEQRIRELQAEIEAAERDNDYARAYRDQVELDAIIDHLTAALGHGNRTRRAGGTTERARSAVTHRVRGAVRQIDKLHPTLGRHLAVAVRTGTYCSYQPEHPVDWQVS